MEVLITKESGIQLANPVYFRLTPLTVKDALNRSVISSEFEQDHPDNRYSPNRASKNFIVNIPLLTLVSLTNNIHIYSHRL